MGGDLGIPGIPNSEGCIDEVVFVHATPTRGICFVVMDRSAFCYHYKEVNIDLFRHVHIVNIGPVMQHTCHF